MTNPADDQPTVHLRPPTPQSHPVVTPIAIACAVLRAAGARRERARTAELELERHSALNILDGHAGRIYGLADARLEFADADKALRQAALAYARERLDAAGESGTTDACLLLLQLQAQEV